MPNWLICLTVLIYRVSRRQAPIRQERFEIGGTRGGGVSRGRRGAIQPVQRAPQRADPARPRTAVLAGRAAALEVAGGLASERGDRRQGQAGRKGNRCQPSPPGACP